MLRPDLLPFLSFLGNHIGFGLKSYETKFMSHTHKKKFINLNKKIEKVYGNVDGEGEIRKKSDISSALSSMDCPIAW